VFTADHYKWKLSPTVTDLKSVVMLFTAFSTFLQMGDTVEWLELCHQLKIYEVSVSYCGENVGVGLLGYNTVWTGR
jgi:hypothetical protein